MSVVQGYFAQKDQLSSRQSSPCSEGATARLQGDFLGRAGASCQSRVWEVEQELYSRLSWLGGWSSLTLLQAGEWEDAAAVSQPCSRRVHVAACLHRLFFPVAIFLLLHCSYTKPTALFSFFPPEFSAEKYPFYYLVGKQKLGLCQALEQLQRMKMVMVASSKPHFWLPLL